MTPYDTIIIIIIINNTMAIAKKSQEEQTGTACYAATEMQNMHNMQNNAKVLD